MTRPARARQCRLECPLDEGSVGRSSRRRAWRLACGDDGSAAATMMEERVALAECRLRRHYIRRPRGQALSDRGPSARPQSERQFQTVRKNASSSYQHTLQSRGRQGQIPQRTAVDLAGQSLGKQGQKYNVFWDLVVGDSA